ncbi:MAG: metal-dependent phosphohydrolase [Phycisphaeraceae bacterium]|nr:metal-dependent phosphohydrolase [Phycisphaeraceae bacterium]
MPDEDIVSRILAVFRSRGGESYGREAVTQLEHALQAATLARQNDASQELIAAALLHDIGHLLGDDADHPITDQVPHNLDDAHEARGYRWLCDRFGPEVSDPVRLHVAAKRYLCTVHPEYLERLSPTSLQSFHDQGGTMSHKETRAFESEANYEPALSVRRWDDAAKVVGMKTPAIEDFMSELKASLGT